jgi:group I intron endonuclease
MDKIYTIYKIENLVNGKCYIGFDSDWPRRVTDHKSYNYSERDKKNKLLYKAFQKYGLDQFEFEPIYRSHNKEHTLNVMENYYIKSHDSHFKDGWGYNMSYGGEGQLGYKHSKETKIKMSVSHRGRKISEKHRQKLCGEGNPFFGKKHSEESKKKMSKSSSGNSSPWYGKKHSEETKQKMREAALSRSEEYRKKCQDAAQLRILREKGTGVGSQRAKKAWETKRRNKEMVSADESLL